MHGTRKGLTATKGRDVKPDREKRKERKNNRIE